MGYDKSDYAGKPVIAIINTWSDNQPPATRISARAPRKSSAACGRRADFRSRMPAIALAEPFQKPSTMMYRNFLAMETEELLRSYFRLCVLMGGCDKTRPLSCARSRMRLPMIYLPAGPMLRATGTGRCSGSGSDSHK